MDLQTALGLLADRIDGTTPTERTGDPYRHDKDRLHAGDPVDRSYTVAVDELEFFASPEQYHCTVDVEVNYAQRTNAWEATLDAARDLEDLVGRLVYRNGQEWAKAQGLDVQVTRARSTEEDSTPRIEITCNLIWLRA